LLSAYAWCDAKLIQRSEQICGIAVDAECAGLAEFVFAVASAQEPDTEDPRTTRSQKIPHGIANDVTFSGRQIQPPLALEKQIGLGFRAQDISSFHDNSLCADAEGLERCIDLRAVS
jgi:hypothetical protein